MQHVYKAPNSAAPDASVGRWTLDAGIWTVKL